MTEQQIQRFVEEKGIDNEYGHFAVMVEEMGEFADAFNTNDREQAKEELADLAITVRVMAELMEIELQEEVDKKMAYNLQKSASKEGGKVSDDAGDVDE